MLYYVDGSSSFIGREIAVTDNDGNLLLSKKYKKELTNNELEYEAIIAALELCENGDSIYSDSKLCVEQIIGNFKIRQAHLEPYATRAKKILETKKVTITWIPRERNLAGKYLEKKVKTNARKRNKESKIIRGSSGKKI